MNVTNCNLLLQLFSGFLQEIIEVLLFLLAAEEDFHCRSLRYLIRELLVNSILIPLIDMVSDPDYINQIIIWLVISLISYIT